MDTKTKEQLLTEMSNIMHKWHKGTRQGNDGNQGNTLEDLLHLKENNISLPDYGVFEIKTQKKESGSLITLFHREPKPDASVPKLLLSMGWPHDKAGKIYPENEMSFRSTTYGHRYSDRGFSIISNINRLDFIFSESKINFTKQDRTLGFENYGDWFNDVQKRNNPNYKEIFPIYYDMPELISKFKEKLSRTLFVLCNTKIINREKYFLFDEAFLFGEIIEENIIKFLNDGKIALDFDARTGHNHGTKFRIDKSNILGLFKFSENI